MQKVTNSISLKQINIMNLAIMWDISKKFGFTEIDFVIKIILNGIPVFYKWY